MKSEFEIEVGVKGNWKLKKIKRIDNFMRRGGYDPPTNKIP